MACDYNDYSYILLLSSLIPSFTASYWTVHGSSSLNGSPRPSSYAALQICQWCPEPQSPRGATYSFTAGTGKSQRVNGFSVINTKNFPFYGVYLSFARLSQLYTFRGRSLSQLRCWLLRPLRSRSRCWVRLVVHNEWTVKPLFILLIFFSIFFFQIRGASFPTDSGHACQPGGKDHWHVAGDRQL